MRLYTVMAVILGLDQFIKYLVKTSMQPYQSIPLLEPVLSLTYVHNQGAAFGVLQGQNLLFVVSAFLVLAVVVMYNHTASPKPGLSMALGMVAGGAGGNLIDRLFSGGVVDYLDLHIWPVFNLADMAIVAGCFVIVLQILFLEQAGDGDA